MVEIFRNSLSELYKKPFAILIVFLLNFFITLGINKTELTPEIFTFFMPMTFIIFFMDKKDIKWNYVFINILIYFVIFFSINYILYKYVEILEQKEFINNGDMILYKLAFLILDILNYIFCMGIFYSVTKKLNSKISVIDMFRYFSKKSSKIILVFYGLILSMFSTVLILYGIDNSLCYNFISVLCLLFSITFLSFLLLTFKNFLLSDKEDDVIFKLKEKNFKFYRKSVLSVIGIVALSIILTTLFFILFTRNQNIFLLILVGISFLISIIAVEIGYLNIFVPLDERKTVKAFTVKKVINTAGINLIWLFIAGILFFIFYTIDMNFFINNTLIFYSIPIVILNYLGIILNFQVTGIFLEKPFFQAFKEGISLGAKFINLKIIPILIGGNIILIINTLNGIFQIVILILNILISLYMLNFYFKENEKWRT